jgi:mono/diheme cytochrome c family protein
MMPDRARPGKIWPLAAKKLKSSGMLALQATLNKDPDLLFKAGEEIYKSCAGCHHAYANFEKSTSAIPREHQNVGSSSNQPYLLQFARH